MRRGRVAATARCGAPDLGETVHTEDIMRFIPALALSALGLVLAPVSARAADSRAATAQDERTVRAGGLAGVGADVGIVSPFGTDSWTVTLAADQPHLVVVVGDGSSDLDVYLYDENGRLIDSDTDATDTCFVSVNPRWTGRFQVVVRNRGGAFNLYSITVG
jgi:hypothetical protein